MKEWENATGYSYVDIGPFHLEIDQDGDGDKWQLTCCPNVFRHSEPVTLASSDINEAKCQAVAKLQVILEESLAEILTKPAAQRP